MVRAGSISSCRPQRLIKEKVAVSHARNSSFVNVRLSPFAGAFTKQKIDSFELKESEFVLLLPSPRSCAHIYTVGVVGNFLSTKISLNSFA